MIAELYTHNDWLVNNIESLFKFPNSRNLKITFNQAIYALKAQQHGLKLFSIKISNHQIQQEKFYSIKTCFRCYTIEDHLTKDCPQSPDYKICSECTERGHTWRQCTQEENKCINCQENHRTLSMKCKIRKEAIKKKRQEEKEKLTYAQTTKPNTITATHIGPTQISRHSHLQIYSCMIHAHLMNVIEPGSYEMELNATLADNNLPTIKITKTPNSVKLLSILTQRETQERVMETEENTPSTSTTLQHHQQQQEQPQQKQ